MEDGSGTDAHFFGWFPLGPQPLVSLAPGILPLSGSATAKLPESPMMTIAAPSKIEPISLIRILMSAPSPLKLTFYFLRSPKLSNACHILASSIIR